MYYALCLTILAIVSIILLGYEFIPSGNQNLIAIFQRIDLFIAIIFLTDFFAGLFFNTTTNAKTFFQQNWLNLASSIPITSDMTRVLRILRIVRAMRIIRVGINLWFLKHHLTKNHLSE
jgi:type II secretory pathway component PulF